MLSYAEHGKFPAPTQGRRACKRDENALTRPDPAGFRRVPPGKWITGAALTQWSTLESRRAGGALTCRGKLRHSWASVPIRQFIAQ
jgi:hypothetical protein